MISSKVLPESDRSELERLLGDLLLEGEIARTARAAIYRIRIGKEGRPLALKVALEPSDTDDLARFRHEVRLLSEARHPNVVEVYDFGVLPGGFPFLTMERLSGESVTERLRRMGGGWDAFYDAAIQAAAGLAHIHRQGLVHMDLKPGNLGIAEAAAGRLALKILDFGLAQSVRGPLDRRIRGTLAYTAPEVLLQDRYDHRADLYSLGMTLFELATGVLPSRRSPAAGREDGMAAIRFHLEGEPPDPRELRPDVPPALALILLRLLRRDPAERHASADRLLIDLAEAAGRRADAGALALSEGTVLASRLVAREEVLGRLRADLAAAAEGRGGAVLIEGPEGVGKSRLLRELRLLAAIGGARVGRGQSSAEGAESARPLAPFLDALAALGIDVQETRADPGEVGAAGETGPRERYRLYFKIALALARAAAAPEAPPLLLLIDDLHCAGRESEELFRYLADELRTARVLVVATRRPSNGANGANGADGAEDANTRPAERGGSINVLPLVPLDRSETGLLVDACLGTSGFAASFYGWIHDHARGLPGETQQLVRRLADGGVLLYRDGDWKPSLAALARWASGAGTEAQEGEWHAALPAGARAALEAVAVAGEPQPLAALAAILESDPEEIYGGLSSLVADGVLERLEEAEGTQYGLSRRRLLRAVYEGMEPERRRQLHRRLAVFLEQRLEERGEKGRVAAVAEHFRLGGERARNLPYLLRAAEESAAVYGYGQAAAFYGRAAEIAAETGAGETEVRALASQAGALASAGSYPRALRVYQDLLGRLAADRRRPRDRAFIARLLLARGRLHTRLGEHEAALECHEEGLLELASLDEPELEIDLLHGKALALRDLSDWEAAFSSARSALARAGRGGFQRQRASLLNSLGMIYSARGDWRRAGRLIRRGLWVAEREGDEVLCLTLRNNLGLVLWKTGAYEAAIGYHRRNLAFCERTHDLWGQLFALNNLGILECSRGNWRAAREPLTRSLELKRRLGARENEALARLNLGEVEEVLGNWPRAQRHYERALRLLEDTPDHPERLAALTQLASLDRKRGRTADAERRLREALAGAERIGAGDLLIQASLQLGLLEEDRENFDAASLQLGKALELGEVAGTREALARIHTALADLALRRGDPGALVDAEFHARAARARLEETGDRFSLGWLLSIEARLAGAGTEADRAERLFAEGVRLLEELEAPYEHARSLYEWGLRTWNQDIALRRLRQALSGFEKLGAETECRRARGAIEGIREHQRLAGAGGRGAKAVLYEVLKVVNSTLDLREVLNRTMDLVLERLGAERGMIVLADPLTRDLEIAAARNIDRGGEGRGEVAAEGRALSESVVRRVIESREPVLAVDALTDGRFAGAESIVARHIVSILCVPLAIRDRPAGAIYLDHRQSSHLFGQADLEFLVAFADQAAIAIENARLYGEVEASRLRLKEENESLRREVLSSHHLGALIGKSRPITELKRMLERVAQNPSTVLIRGESGTGKGLVARILHTTSPRRQAPFIHFNCAALPETLVESELFGHEKGAFTGASAQKPGRFELAHNGTIFLDEIGKVSPAIQSKLLRVVEDKEFERVGGTRTLRSDVRIIAATNLDLEEAITRNEFREDLFYRLNIIPLMLPPLRERREDIPYLVQHFLRKIGRDLGRPPKDLEPAVLDLFLAHEWPGNVRELESAIHRALVLAPGETLTVDDFGWIAQHLQGRGASAPAPSGGTPADASDTAFAEGAYEEALARHDRRLIAAALAKSGGRIRETARLLGIARNTLKAKMKRYGLQESGE